MPAILPRSAYGQWLDPAVSDTGALAKLLAPYPETEMRAYAVSQLVNNPRNDGPECVEAV